MSVEKQIRTATKDDYDFFLRLFPELSVPVPPPERGRWEREMMPLALIAEVDGKESGYAWWAATGPKGHLRHIIVDPKCRQDGVGSTLMERVAYEMRTRGCTKWVLNVRPENLSAIRLYKRFGFQRKYGSASVRFTWDILLSLQVEPTRTMCQLIEPEDDSKIETIFGISPGVFEEARTLGGRALLQLVSSKNTEKPLAACIFDPAFPGAYPFRVQRPSLARRLLEEMKKSADPNRNDVVIVVENDEALEETLVAAGAKVVLRFDFYSGDIPENHE